MTGPITGATRIWNDWALAARVAGDRWQRIAAERYDQLTRLQPPERLADFHRRLLPLAENVGGEPTESWVEAARRAGPWLERRQQLKTELRTPAVEGSERRYADAIRGLLDAGDREYSATARECERVTARAIRKLTRLRRPDSVATQHKELIAALTEAMAAERDFYESALAGDGSSLAAAATRVEAAYSSLEDWRQRALTVLGT